MLIYYIVIGFFYNYNLVYILGEISLYCKILFEGLINLLFYDKNNIKFFFGII